MSLSSSFTDFSLAELFQLIEQGRKSGCLTVCNTPDGHAPASGSQYYYIWFRQGRFIAAANRLNGQGLVAKILQRGWVLQRPLEDLYVQAPPSSPFGLTLKTLDVLSAEQLNLLFGSQMQQVKNLFEIQEGVFQFDGKATMPWMEMTGLSLSATEVAIMALRALKNWQVLADALPEVDSAIKSTSKSQPLMRLNTLEWQVWEFASGCTPLKAIANQINQPIHIVQQAAFRLMLANLVEEIPFAAYSPNNNDYHKDFGLLGEEARTKTKSKESESLKVSSSFLQNLVGYLRSKS